MIFKNFIQSFSFSFDDMEIYIIRFVFIYTILDIVILVLWWAKQENDISNQFSEGINISCQGNERRSYSSHENKWGSHQEKE